MSHVDLCSWNASRSWDPRVLARSINDGASCTGCHQLRLFFDSCGGQTLPRIIQCLSSPSRPASPAHLVIWPPIKALSSPFQISEKPASFAKGGAVPGWNSPPPPCTELSRWSLVIGKLFREISRLATAATSVPLLDINYARRNLKS